MQQPQKEEQFHNLTHVNVAELPIEKTLEHLLFVNVDYKDTSKLRKLHSINDKQQKHILKTLEDCLKNIKKAITKKKK